MREPFVIKKIDTYLVDYPLLPGRAVAWTCGVHDRTHCMVVSVTDQTGCKGYGETVLTLPWTGESPELAKKFTDQYLAPLLIDRPLENPGDAAELMDELATGWESSKGALDCAIWDLWGKRQNRSVAELVGDRTPVDRLLIRASISGHEIDHTVMMAKRYWDMGVRILKFKVGLPGVDDAKRLSTVRAELGEEPIFSIDANNAYASADEAVRAYETMAPSRINLFEQPTTRRRISMMAEVRRRVDVPIMADESVFSPVDLEEAIALDACDWVSLYPYKNGSFTHCIAMARRAAEAGIKCALGSALETDLGQGAMAALAAAFEVFPVDGVGHDLQAVLFYEKSSIREPMPFKDGYIHVPKGPGFGVEPTLLSAPNNCT